MRADEGKRLCQEAEAHYYDLLGPDEAAVPESVRRHVAACPACQEQMHRLREALFEAQHRASPARSGDDETIAALAQQFQLLDEHVACADVKPFLPKLALAAPQIRIPTPVTVHVDHCPRCAEDLAALRALDLTPDQLQRLSKFFESGGGAGIPPLRSQCRAKPDGRGARAAEAQESRVVEDADIVCSAVTQADLFDDAVPYGAPQDQRHRVVCAHIHACRTCREKAQTLRRQIGAILERADSETTTVYHAESDVADTPGDVGHPYPYPIGVEVFHGESGCGAGPGTKRRYSTLFPARHLAPAAVVAVVLVATLMLRWVNAPIALGTDVGDLLKPLAEIRSVHMLAVDGHGKPIQEFWIAYRSDRLVVMKRTTEQYVLYDLAQGRMRTIEPGTGVGPPTRLSKVQWDGARRLVGNCLRDVMMCVSPDTKLPPPTGDLASESAENLDVYETTWLSHTGSLSPHSRRRVYIDPATGLPQRMEFYQERPAGTRGRTYWDLLTTTVFTYPAEQEMDRDIESMFPAQ